MMLAPIVQNRKGEHLHVFQNLISQGFIRARIDGIITDLDDTPKLEKTKKHTIEVVVDRFKVRPDIQQRISESFETCLTLTDGIAVIADMDEESPNKELIFSSKFACNICGYAINELEPRMFSFNNPAGACPCCDGLGVKQFFDPSRIIHDPTLTLAEGAIRGWDRRSIYYFQLLTSLAQHYKIDIDTPFETLPDDFKQAILYGTGSAEISFNYINSRGDTVKRLHPFEGVIPNIERRYQETDSNMGRDEIAKYLNNQHCPD